MKKLLNMLGSFTLFLSTLTSVTSCQKPTETQEVFEVTKQLDIIDDNDWTAASEKFSNKFHVQTPKDKGGMINDISGAYFKDGYWHVYFLYNWEARYNEQGEQVGGNGTEWYHVMTKDWINWEYKGVAVKKWHDWGDAAAGTLYEDVDGDFGAVVPSNLKGENQKGGFVAFATAYGGEKGQNIMAFYSKPENYGFDFDLIQKEPILKNGKEEGTYPDFRDPFFLKKDGKFYLYISETDKFGVYESETPLGNYKKIGEYKPLHGMVECPLLYKLNVNGDKNNQKWVFIYGGNGNNENDQPNKVDKLGTGTYYSIGHLDDKGVFVEEQEAKRLDFGADFYAAKFWQDKSSKDDINDHLIGTGWMSSWDYNRMVPNEGKWGNMSLAREIKLVETEDKYYIQSQFLGLDNLQKTSSGSEKDLKNNHLKGGSYKIDLNFKNIKNNISNISFGDDSFMNKLQINYANNTISTQRSTIFEPLKNNGGFTQLRKYQANLNNLDSAKIQFIVDKTTIEAIMPDGTTISMVKFPSEKEAEKVKLESSTDISLEYDYYQL
ncbi:levanbiose-producing levanase [Spiroplasma helicoides]|uniref:Levanbiose-producing levanase n=1 Tax=Spiroplasma helicoides TaxID=216938 RepID=A0A1B3SJX9_9MOLU|nr:glycoside hydrolase family 32 protein [Spiroplasma helicoides]AOG60227.1 levanbiose-producing levanase [Spiroplasma helicoides]